MTDTKAPEKKPGRKIIQIAILLLLLGGGFAVWRFLAPRDRGPDNVITLSGRVEGDDSAVSPKTTGRILEIRYREGDMVKAGDTIALLDDEQVRDREEQARADRKSTRLNSSHLGI